jgi:hypothetical protein
MKRHAQDATGKRGPRRKYLPAKKRKQDETDYTPIASHSVSNRELLRAGGWRP